MNQLLNKITRAYRAGGIREVGRRAYVKHIDPYIRQSPLFMKYPIRKERERIAEIVADLEKSGVGKRLTRSDLIGYKTSETLFILGSGGSINQITDDQWAVINQHDSVGLNRWPIHEFIPTYYVFELPTANDKMQQSFYNKMRQKFYELLEYRKEDYANTPTIIKDIDRASDIIKSSNIESHIKGKLLLSRDTCFPKFSSNPESQRRLINWLESHGYFSPKRPLDLIYRERASITYLMHLASLLGYKNIVLCGVDMVDSEYFFTNRKAELEARGVPIPESDITDRSQTHPTNEPDSENITLEILVYMINDVALQPNDINLYVENTLSALHPRIPVYDYECT